MDILIHILLLVIIAGLFFIYKYSNTYNPMMFVIIFSLLGFLLIMVSDIELIGKDYTELVSGNTTTITYDKINLTNEGIGLMNVQSFFVLVYLWMFLISMMNMVIGDKSKEYK